MTILQIPSFRETQLVRHGFSTRLGGVSAGDFASLDLGLYNGDDDEAVRENRQRFVQALGLKAERVVCPHQVHGDHIQVVTAQDGGRGFGDKATALADTDGLVTDVPDLALWACFADCTPLFFLDQVRRVIGLSHAGWKGTAAKIGAKTIAVMQEQFGSRPEDILVGIGPSIGPCHYEVDAPVAARFRAEFAYAETFLRPKAAGKWQLDLWTANRLQLIEAGVPKENITVSGYCTACRTDWFYSYRAQGGRCGRMAAVIALKA